MLNVNQTVRSYSGKPGCMCGCNGSYNEGERARKMAMTALLKNPNVRVQAWNSSADDAGCLFADTDTRTRVLYLTAQGVEAVRAMGVEETV
jgi:hypothetical protein